MHIRTFRAANLNAALAMIREQMGPDASVLHTREVPPPRLNIFARSRVEVTAGLRPAGIPSPPPRTAPAAAATPPAEETGRDSITPRMRLHPARERLVEELITAGLPTRVARSWAEHRCLPPAALPGQHVQTAATGQDSALDQSHDLPMLRQQMAEWLERSLRIGNPITLRRGSRRVVALVGPTGVGKTTTIAKLAAGFQLQEKARVGLLTLDTFRAAAIEQLDAFARALGVPLAVVRSPAEVAAALGQLSDVDLVLIDTVGQSPCGKERIAAMGRLLAAARPDETHLVVDAHGSFAAAADICGAFKPLQPTAAIISKLDEVRRPAPVIAGLLEGALQVSYLTAGQRVPEDIAAADRTILARLASGLAVSGCGA